MLLLVNALQFVLWLFSILVIARIVFDMVQSYSPRWRPRGAMVLVAEAIYTPTDPPVKALRRLIPMVPIGGIRLDLSCMVLLLIVGLLSSVLGMVARGMV